MKLKYKVGDTVITSSKPPLNISEGPSWATGMRKYCGKKGIITECKTVKLIKRSYIIYHLDITNNTYWWDERWLQLYDCYLEDELFNI